MNGESLTTGSTLYTVGRNGLIQSFVVPTGMEHLSRYDVNVQTRDLLGGLITIVVIGIILLTAIQFFKR